MSQINPAIFFQSKSVYFFNEKEKSEKIEKINEGKVHTDILRVFFVKK